MNAWTCILEEVKYLFLGLFFLPIAFLFSEGRYTLN